MSISQVNFAARTIADFFNWFVELYNHLGAANYSSGTWTPVLSGFSGSPTVSGYYHRLGKNVSMMIQLTGNIAASGATITGLPVLPKNGTGTIINESDVSLLGVCVVNSTGIALEDFSVTGKTVMVSVNYSCDGI